MNNLKLRENDSRTLEASETVTIRNYEPVFREFFA